MDDNWLQLTEEDIERAQRLARYRSLTPEVLTITDEDVAHAPEIRPTTSTIRITEDDITPIGAQRDATRDERDMENQMLKLINDARNAHLPSWLGTATLKWDDILASVARGHSHDMLKRQYVAHLSPEGVSAARRISMNGLKYFACGENIGVFYSSQSPTITAIDDIHSAFMNQPKSMTNHRGNVLNPIWTHVGIGVAINQEGALVVTQNFISAPLKHLRQA